MPLQDIVPGWKAGTKIKYPASGHETVTPSGAVRQQDLHFIIEEKPHETFKRDGDDLIYTFRVPLVDALTGSAGGNRKSLKHLDGREVSFTVPYPSATSGGAPLKPGQTIKVVGEGMPISKKASAKKKGDLLIKIDVVMPDRLTTSQMEGVRRVLG